jgi:linoleoyl-CoA desaturase
VSAYLIIPILITGSFKVVFLYYIAHFMGLSFFITTIFLIAHVTNVQKLPMSKEDAPKDWAIRQLETTADFAVNNKFLGFAIGGLNFQVEHHIFPNICSIHYPAIQEIVKRMSKEWNINYHEAPTIWSAVKGHYFHLKRLGITDTGSTPACRTAKSGD